MKMFPAFGARIVVPVAAAACLMAGTIPPAYAAPSSVNVLAAVNFQDPITGSTGGTGATATGETSIERQAAMAGLTESGLAFDLFASASANLGSGELQIFSEALGAGWSTATAGFTDRLYFSGPFNGCGTGTLADPFTCYRIGLGMTVGGSYTGGDVITGAIPFASLFASGGFDSLSFRFDLINGSVTQSGFMNVIGSPFTIGLVVRLNELGFNVVNGELDFSNTAAVTLTLPPGVTYTSESGVFLTSVGATSPVPEPSTVLLLSAGLAGARLWRVRRGKRLT